MLKSPLTSILKKTLSNVSKVYYCTHVIISRGLYVFTTFFTAVYIRKWLILQTIYVLNKDILQLNSRMYGRLSQHQPSQETFDIVYKVYKSRPNVMNKLCWTIIKLLNEFDELYEKSNCCFEMNPSHNNHYHGLIIFV